MNASNDFDRGRNTVFPASPDLDQLKRQAKELLAAARSGDEQARSRLADRPSPQLADAQFVIAREHGFASWPRMRRSIVGADGDQPVRRANVADAHTLPSTFLASTFLDAAKRNGWQPNDLPETLIFVFQNGFARQLEHDERFVEDSSMAVANGRYFQTERAPRVAVSCMSAGGAFVGQVENQVALGGASNFVLLNLAGGLGTDVRAGDLAVVEAAVRDDAISHRYLPPGDVVDADEQLSERLLRATRSAQPDTRVHTSWTNPATFRQTREEIDHYIDAGVTIVESEIASLFAVTSALGVRGAAAVLVSGMDEPTAKAVDWSALAATHRAVLDAIVDEMSS